MGSRTHIIFKQIGTLFEWNAWYISCFSLLYEFHEPTWRNKVLDPTGHSQQKSKTIFPINVSGIRHLFVTRYAKERRDFNSARKKLKTAFSITFR